MDAAELRRYEHFKEQAQFYQGQAYHLEAQLGRSNGTVTILMSLTRRLWVQPIS